MFELCEGVGLRGGDGILARMMLYGATISFGYLVVSCGAWQMELIELSVMSMGTETKTKAGDSVSLVTIDGFIEDIGPLCRSRGGIGWTEYWRRTGSLQLDWRGV